MKYMIGFPIAWALTFIAFAFINFTWDAGAWSVIDRMACVLFGMTWGVALSYRIKRDCTWSY